jgi:hypothetical protein
LQAAVVGSQPESINQAGFLLQFQFLLSQLNFYFVQFPLIFAIKDLAGAHFVGTSLTAAYI